MKKSGGQGVRNNMVSLKVTNKKDIIKKDKARYLSFPYITRTNSGDYLIAYRDAGALPGVRAHGASDGTIKLIRSKKQGWTDPITLYSTQNKEAEEMDCILSRLKDGTLLIFSRLFGKKKGVYIAKSTDDGKTFSKRKEVVLQELGSWWCPWGKIIELENGNLLANAYCYKPGDENIKVSEADRKAGFYAPFSSACIISEDKGESWRLFSWIAVCDKVNKTAFCETSIVELREREFYALIRTDGTMYHCRSYDECKTWSKPEPAFTGMALMILKLANGNLLVTHRVVNEKEHGAIPERNLYCARISEDNGKNWSKETVIDDGKAFLVGSYGMGDICELEDGSVKVVYYTSDIDEAPWLQEAVLIIE